MAWIVELGNGTGLSLFAPYRPGQASVGAAKRRHSTVDKFLSTKLSRVQRAALAKGAYTVWGVGDLVSKTHISAGIIELIDFLSRDVGLL